MAIPQVLVSVPTRGAPRWETVMALQAIRDACPGLPPILYLATRLSVCDGRNQIVRDFLREERYRDLTHLVMVDDDIVPNRDLLRFVTDEPGFDIVAAPVLIHRTNQPVPIPNVFVDSPDPDEQARGMFRPMANPFAHYGTPDVVEVTGVGTGAIAIARRVLEHADLRPAFQHSWDDDGAIYMTEDLTFCRRAKALGFRIWADFSVASDQVTTVPLGHLSEKFHQAFAPHVRAATAPSGSFPEERRSTGGLYLP